MLKIDTLKKICILSVLAWVLLLSGCHGTHGTAPKENTAPGWQQHANEPVTLSWYVNFSWFTSTWDDNLVAKTITDETGIKIDFIMPGGNEREKLNAMMTAGTLPDLITLGHWEPQGSQLIDEDLVYPLNELADKYDPFFWQVAQPQRVAWYTRQDGNIYEYPNSSYTPEDYETHKNIGANQVFLVRKDIYEGIGSPDMTTPEGFLQGVRDAAEKYPSSGENPLIPIGLYEFDKDGCYSLEEILMNFLAIPFEKDGKKYDRYTDPDYLRWLKVFRTLYEEGYLSDEIFVDRRAQMAEKVSEGRYFCMIYQHTDIADQQKLLWDKSPEKIYIAVDGPKNSAGDDPTLPGVGINGWTVTLISKNCKNPDRAIQMLSYMMSEHGQKILYCGVEGMTYDMKDGQVLLRPEVLKLLNSDRVEYNRVYAADNTYWMLQDNIMQLDWQPTLEPPLAQPREWTFPYTIYAAQYDINFGENTEAANINQKIREEWGKTLPALLLAADEKEFDDKFDAFLKKREALGFDVIQKESTLQIQAANEKLAALPDK